MLRPAALKTSISTVLAAPTDKEENILYITVNNENVNRVNVIATVVEFSPEDKSLLLDDGTGQLPVQWFDARYNLTVGDTVMLIGRIRQYSHRYVFPEIIKRISDKSWVEVRRLELKDIPKVEESPLAVEEDIDESALKLIHEMDTGEGAEFDSVVEKLGPRGDDIIKRLLMAGEIFESKPGRLRLL